MSKCGVAISSFLGIGIPENKIHKKIPKLINFNMFAALKTRRLSFLVSNKSIVRSVVVMGMEDMTRRTAWIKSHLIPKYEAFNKLVQVIIGLCGRLWFCNLTITFAFSSIGSRF